MTDIPQRLELAVQHHQAGRLAEAEGLYRGILSEEPGHTHALHLLGVLALQARRHRLAIELIQKALAFNGPHPEFHNNLGAAFLGEGLLSDAESHFRAAVRLKPDYADAYYNLGIVLRSRGQIEEAARAFRETLRRNPNHAGARRNLGTVEPQQGTLADASARLREVIRLDPGNSWSQNELGLVLLADDRAEEAVRHLEEAIRLRPEFAEAQWNLGVARRHLHQTDEALTCFREALRISPAFTQARNSLGCTLEAQGNVQEALAEFRETLRQDPNNAQAIFLLSELSVAGHHRFRNGELQCFRELARRPDLSPADQTRLHFALGALLDKAGDVAEAFDHYRRGNELRKQLDRRCGVAYNPATHARAVDRLIAAYSPAYFERVRSFGVESELPVFIVGMPRSGTTLAEQILASHPLAHGAGELRDVGTWVATLPQRLGSAEPYPECLAAADAAALRSVAEAHLLHLRQLGGATARVIDKAPLNFLHLGLIATLFPRARIIHCRRDPVDTCLSCFFQNFAGLVPFTTDLRHLGHYYREYDRLMAHWATVLPVPVFELRYEELTADQEAVSRSLVDFCGLVWDDRCLRFNETRRVVTTASVLQVLKPMYRSSVGRWKRYESHLRPLLEALTDGVTSPADGEESSKEQLS